MTESTDTPEATVDKAGSMLGSGAIVVMDDTTDMVRVAHRVVRFFARESCGKCSPCREGTTWEEQVLRRIHEGHGRPGDIDMLLDVADNISPGRAESVSTPGWATPASRESARPTAATRR